MGLFKESEHKRIERHVTQAEGITSGEIVVFVARSSAGYTWVHWFWLAMGLVAGTAAGTSFSWAQWPLTMWELLQLQTLGMAAGFALSWLPPLRRLVLRRSTLQAKVHRSAMASFVSVGVAETPLRNGVLIYLSEFEHMVEILADRAFHGVLDNAYWKTHTQAIATGIRSGRGVDAVCAAIDAIATKLAEHFPPIAGSQSQLPNTVVTGLKPFDERD